MWGSFGENCACAPRLTAGCPLLILSCRVQWIFGDCGKRGVPGSVENTGSHLFLFQSWICVLFYKRFLAACALWKFVVSLRVITNFSRADRKTKMCAIYALITKEREHMLANAGFKPLLSKCKYQLSILNYVKAVIRKWWCTAICSKFPTSDGALSTCSVRVRITQLQQAFTYCFKTHV